MRGEGASFAMPRLGWRPVVAGVLALAVIGVLLAARFGGADGKTASPGSTTGTPVAASSASPTPSPSPEPDDGPEGPGTSPYDEPAAPRAMTAATSFVKAWADHPAGITAERWWSAVSRHADPALAAQLKFTEPALVPAKAVTGPAESVAGGPSSATVAVPTDAGRVLVTCVLVKNQWLVSDLDLERAPA
jgi:hypothetical protein